MKKIIIAIFIVVLLLLAGIYWFIPGTLTVTTVTSFPGTVTGVNRALLQKENWKKFWTGEKAFTPDTTFTNNDLLLQQNDTFRITKLLPNSFIINIASNVMQENSTLLVLPLSRGAVGLSWSYNITTSANPIKRWQQYRHAVNLKKTMDTELQSMNQFLSITKNVYGINIEQTSTHDTMLVSTYRIMSQYPGTADVYSLISKLQAYIAANHALQTGNPLLNVTPLSPQQYKVMVALPTNKMLNGQGDIVYKRMIPGGFLITTITGGDSTINNAYKQMQYFFQDYQRVAMAIPFQVLITDRLQQTDTSKWITKVYFPVM